MALDGQSRSDTLVKVIEFLMDEDWYKVAGHLNGLELAFPDEYAEAKRHHDALRDERARFRAAIEYQKSEVRRLEAIIGG